ncbi:hypothetical protein CONCODRAFT_68923 [Conidiobolus coronatus NRRL 28638]|uniref:AN1-type domain-containing protein n=1 Tax=Conidiobolus coronatus (strain ATCC 28846 / CBS 209.66 / NRRL 28638) TaxID=796925 RepID=A0A137PBX4_CONC2|nr:hypothetical protein CONCODRAFT_68923 [Conidiobolus coronatus NRRL 28638]|eukprot:KXN72514.1 hypothetical protein CONCODRAFT_68923 [Conidiobolus coronatus NRRL 28638]
MVELHHIGANCNLSNCNKLDFLPFKCPNCRKEYCDEHYHPEQHGCKAPAPIVDVVVPTCPVCNQPVPFKRGEDPNIAVNNHISRNCKNPPSPTPNSKVCQLPACKAKTVVAQICSDCKKSFCMKHRFPQDHKCTPPPPPPPSKSTQLFNGFKNKLNAATNAQSYQDQVSQYRKNHSKNPTTGAQSSQGQSSQHKKDHSKKDSDSKCIIC